MGGGARRRERGGEGWEKKERELGRGWRFPLTSVRGSLNVVDG